MRKNLIRGLEFDENSPIYFKEGYNYDAERLFLKNINSGNKRIGETNINKYGSKLEILEYNGYYNVIVGIDTKEGDIFNRYNCTYQNFKKGEISSPYERRIQNVGFTGDGEFGTIENQYFFSLFTNMMNRVYNKNVHIVKPGYIGTNINISWHNFQNFCQWCLLNYYTINNEEMHLDKDLLFKYNKEYGPFTCTFLPQTINKIFARPTDISKKELPTGITIRKERNYKIYESTCCYTINGLHHKDHIGFYDTVEDAFSYYKEYKERVIKDIANDYWFNKGGKDIPQFKIVYEAMMNYAIEYND